MTLANGLRTIKDTMPVNTVSFGTVPSMIHTMFCFLRSKTMEPFGFYSLPDVLQYSVSSELYQKYNNILSGEVREQSAVLNY